MQWYFINKQIGGNRSGRNQSTKIHFNSPVKIIYKKRKLLRFKDLQMTSNPQPPLCEVLVGR